ncbi:Histidine kinase [Bacillus atrophaeus]|nr:Histidine kinase [Bacillus atrophaeus]
MKKYQARIISTSLAMIFILFWDYIFYYIEKNPINWPVDILFSAVVIFSVWMMAYYFDQKQQLIEKV